MVIYLKASIFLRICLFLLQKSPEIQQEISKKYDSSTKPEITSKISRTPLILTYNHNLPDIKRTVNEHWDILKINRDLEQVFTELPITTFRQNRNLQDILVKKINRQQSKTTTSKY